MLEVGSIIDGKYKILRVVGKGGMSVVYQAVNERANKIWAIKEVRKDGVQNFEVVKQNLIAETELLKRFNHPNLPSIIDVIDGDGTFLIVMDYIEGNSLDKALESGGAQKQEDVIEWSKQLCDVLGYLHSRKPPIIYRDMKPANVMLKPDGNISLIDFGTAREFKSAKVEDTTCLGTQGYAAPEQYGGHGQTDARTDIYCLGATMYHLITGHNPSTPPYEMYPIRQWNPMLSSGLEEIILKCTQRNPADRYQSCAELLYALDHYQDLDIENKKVQSFKWKTFMASAILTVVMLVATIIFSISSAAMTSSTYDALITKASNSEDDTIYLQAIDLEPGNLTAYMGLLDLYMKDETMMDDEYSNLVSVVTDNEAELKADDNDAFLNDFVMPLADDLFFCYDQNGSRNGILTSATWYDKARAEDNANDKNKEKAQLMYTFASNYNNRAKLNKKGESSISVDEYWQALKVMSDPNLMEKENVAVALNCYLFVSSELFNQNSWLYSQGVPKAEYDAMLNNVEQYTNNITATDIYKANEITYGELVTKIMSNIESAREQSYGSAIKASSEGEGE